MESSAALDSAASDCAASDSAALDSADPLARYRERFLRDPDVVSYLDGNSLGRPLAASRDRIHRFIEEEWAGRLIRGWDEGWLDLPERIGDDLGRVALGAAPGQVTIGDSTTVLLYKLIRAAVAAQPGRHRLVVARDEFPTDRYVVEGIAQETGLTVSWLGDADAAASVRVGVLPRAISPIAAPRVAGPDTPPSSTGVTAEMLRDAVDDDTAVVVLSHVSYRSGYLADVPELTRIAHDVGALVVWDLSHSVGVVPAELDAWGVDLATGCGYKYLNGGPGAPAFAYVNASLHGSLRQPIHGWLGVESPFEMGQGYRPAAGIRSFTSGTPPIIGMLAMQDMISLIDEIGIGAIRSKSELLTAFAVDLVDELFPDATLSSPRDPARRGSHITIDREDFGDLVPRLWAQGVLPDFRRPSGVRIGLSPLSTSFAEVELGLWAMRHPG